MKCLQRLQRNLLSFIQGLVDLPYIILGMTHPQPIRTQWGHDMERLSALLALCEGNPPVTGGFPSQKANNAELWFFFLLLLAKQADKQTVKMPVVWIAVYHITDGNPKPIIDTFFYKYL